MKRIDLRKAFTMIELIFIIIIVGILALVATPRLNDNNLRLAADQLMSHIRYTQHLAMQADKFDPNDADWFKKRWQLIVIREGTEKNKLGSEGEVAYTIFEDTAGGSTGNPDLTEIAKNPLNPEKLLTGGVNNIKTSDKRATSELNLGKKYGIKEVTFSNTCSVTGSRRVIFDYLGRPMKGNLATYTSSYQKDRLISAPCEITLEHKNGENITITIEPETGFVDIKN